MNKLHASLLAMALGAGVGAGAQQIGFNTNPDQAQSFKLTINSQLVVETVVVKDKKGNFVPGLTAKDFTVTEGGVPQTIKIFEHEQLNTTATPLPRSKPADEDITIYKTLTRTKLAPEAPDSNKYKDKRLLALYFDMTAMPPADQMRALAAAEKFVRTQMTTADLIAIMRYQWRIGGHPPGLHRRPQPAAEHSGDHGRRRGPGLGRIPWTMPASADTGAAFGQDDSEFNVFNTDRQLSALQTAARMLGQMNEKKSLIYFASGLRLNGIDNQAQMHATVDAAIRDGVSFWPVDARGLVAGAPMGDATQGSPGRQGMYTGASAQAVTDRFQQSQDTHYALAGDTGGKALLDNNDLTRGIVQAQQAISDYYIIGYYTTNTAQNGQFRRVKITLTPERRRPSSLIARATTQTRSSSKFNDS